ncbi:MAG: Crp/Fnr family transcriptional regulator [Crocinitomicaceae bacterium]
MKVLDSQKQLVIDRIGFLFEEELLKEILSVGKIQKFKSDEIIIDVDQNIEFMPFILEGSLKVSREAEDGQELLLYYIESGETCAFTLQCCVRESRSEIRATTIEETTILTVPISKLHEWMGKYDSWRKFVLESYHTRMTELIETIDAIAFTRLDQRLENYLKDQAKLKGSLEIVATHQQIAEDLHSSRVVISRLLKQMEVKGLIQQGRNKILLTSI